MRNKVFLILVLAVFFNPLVGAEETQSTKVRVALYNGKGVWGPSYRHLKRFLNRAGLSFRVVHPQEIKEGYLQNQNPELLIMPGGKSWEYLKQLGVEGQKQIKDYVQDGGSYLGICAGAFFASSDRVGGHTTGPYGVGLIEATAYDGKQLGDKNYKNGMKNFDLSLAGFKSRYRVLFLEGPYFRISEQEMARKNVQVFGRFSSTKEISNIYFDAQKGKVALIAAHPEIEEWRYLLGLWYRDPETDWPWLRAVTRALLEKQKLNLSN